MKKTSFLLMLAGVAILPTSVWAAELAPVNTQVASTESAFITSDIDRSGSIDLSEFSNYIEKAEAKTATQASTDFSLMDANKDHKLTLDEMESGEHIAPSSFK